MVPNEQYPWLEVRRIFSIQGRDDSASDSHAMISHLNSRCDAVDPDVLLVDVDAELLVTLIGSSKFRVTHGLLYTCCCCASALGAHQGAPALSHTLTPLGQQNAHPPRAVLGPLCWPSRTATRLVPITLSLASVAEMF
eukprot:gnl/TRDRNA2_/TRDRNA2_156778_c0_seq2.p1 gnl/TRDRNA2_/TRDRNA2_156778_c0~~gnl/TRDRNA2_/TRDRNA2_156778_c0_seq2.p1  ORF type:complete len:138 (+),score=8.82 gnl/TRDRNA2_/TRDRNA2_156778_c0_seq2:182-595(+)